MTSHSLPPNVHVSNHPCLRAKLSQLRSQHANARETKALIHEIALIVGCQALERGLDCISCGTDKSPLGYDYDVQTISPSRIAIVPILRSGLGMLDALQTLLPSPVPVHHLGLYREPTTLQPVEYYNNLPYHSPPPSNPLATSNSFEPSQSSSSHPARATAAPPLAILIDPIIATGGTSVAAIQTLKEWGVERILVISVLGSEGGVRRAAEEWSEGVEIWVGAVDADIDGKGMIVPGLGDVGDRLFLTRGK